MNKIKDYFHRHAFTLWGRDKDGGYGTVIKGYCIAGVVISLKQLTLIKNGKIYNIPMVVSYYIACIKDMIINKINAHRLNKRNITFEWKMDKVDYVKEKYEELFNEKVAVAEINSVSIVVPHCTGIDDK